MYKDSLSKNRIIALISNEATVINNPKNLSDTHAFTNIQELSEVLLDFLEYDVKEPLVSEVGNNIIGALEIFTTGNIHELPNAIVALSTGFESYLKKIAVIRYANDHVRLHGDSLNYLGLLNTTLGSLLAGIVAKKEKRDNRITDLRAPIVTFSYQGTGLRDVIYDEVRELRNKVHNAPKHSFSELSRYFSLAISAYLLALEENILLIRSAIDPIFSYLSKINEDYKKWEYKYVELLGEERQSRLLENLSDLQVVEWKDDVDDSAGSKTWEDELASTTSNVPVKTSLKSLPSENQKLWIIGEAGAGKTTTLQKFSWLQAAEILSQGYLEKSLPIFIQANTLDSANTIQRKISTLLKVSLEKTNELLSKGKIWLLIDAYNEISPSEQENVRRNLKNLIQEFDNIQLTITSRKYGFKDFINIPIYEILPLSDEMIKDFLLRNISSEDEAEKLFTQLTSGNNLLLDFARSPLMLLMITRVVKDGNVPSNRGQLFKRFTTWIFDRERKTPQSNTKTKEQCLAELAYQIRQKGQTFEIDILALNAINLTIKKLNLSADPNLLLEEVIDNNIIERDGTQRISFFHELMLEYFAAIKLYELYLLEPKSIYFLFKEAKWFEVIVMLSGLLDNADVLIEEISPNNLILASVCISSGANISDFTKETFVKTCEKSLSDVKKRHNAATALLEIGNDMALKLIVHTLSPKYPSFSLTSALSRCNRPEIAAVRLLKFGLSGQHRIYQCLKVLQGKVLSKNIVDSPEVEEAEKLLLSSEWDVKHLELINSIGISNNIKPWFEEKIIDIIQTKTLDNVWRASLKFAADILPIEISIKAIEARLSNLELVANGESFYSIYFACSYVLSIKDKAFSREKAFEITRLCLKHKFFSLASKFIELFDLKGSLSVNDIDLESLERVAKDGSITAIFELSKIFSTVDFEPYLEIAAKAQLEKYNLDIIIQNYDKLEQVLKGKDELVKNALLAKASKVSLKNIQKLIVSFNLAGFFRNAGKVTSYNHENKHGFMTDILTGEQLFFKKKSVIKIGNHSTPSSGQIVFYSNVANSNNPEHRKTAHNILVDLDILGTKKLESLIKTITPHIFSLISAAAPHIDFTNSSNLLFDNLIEKGDFNEITKNKDLFSKLASQKTEKIYLALIKFSPKIRVNVFIELIKIFSLESKFESTAKIVRYDDAKKFGFASDLLTNGKIFFHKANAQLEINELNVGMLIKYKALTQNSKHSARQAIGFIVLRD